MCVFSCWHVSVPRWWHQRNHGSLPRDPEEQRTAVPQSLVLAGARRERKDWPGIRPPVHPVGPCWDTGIPGNWPAGAPEGSKSLRGDTDKPERMLTILILILTSQTHAWDVFSLQLEVSRETWHLMNWAINKAWLCPLIICTGHTVLNQTGLDHANKAGHCQLRTHVSQHFTALTEASWEAFYLLTRVRIVCLQSQQDSISESGGGQTRSPLCDDWCRDFLICWLWAKCTSTHFTGYLAQLNRKELSSGSVGHDLEMSARNCNNTCLMMFQGHCFYSFVIKHRVINGVVNSIMTTVNQLTLMEAEHDTIMHNRHPNTHHWMFLCHRLNEAD